MFGRKENKMAIYREWIIINIVIWLLLLIAKVATKEVCYSQDSALYYCNSGYTCCDGNEKCCAEMSTWTIVGIACGCVVFVAIVIVVVCVILKKTSRSKVRVVQAQPSTCMPTGATQYATHMGGGMMLPGQVMPPPPMYDPMVGGSSFNPQFDMHSEFEQFGKMKKKEQFNKNEKKGGMLGPDMTPAPAPAPLRIGQGRAPAPGSGMEPPPYRPPSGSLSPTPEPPNISESYSEEGDDNADGDFEHPPPS